MSESTSLYSRAVSRIPGGVNSPVRACASVGETPRFMESGKGAWIFDVDGGRYIDYIQSWGPLIMGHNFPPVSEAVEEACKNGLSFGCPTRQEVEMAELICEKIPHVEMIRMVNSGTEAVMSALRAARGYTGRDKIIKFAGCYHGHCDSMLVAAGSGAATGGIPDSAGVTAGCAGDTMIAAYNDLESVENLFKSAPDQVAALIVEPVAANMGLVLPEEGFLSGLRILCDRYGALLIFDEVITGFRLGFGGGAQYYGVKPDLVTYGKIIGAGLPVGAYGGRREIMEMVAPAGPVYQAGTLSGNPVAMSAGLAQLRYLSGNLSVYENLERAGDRLFEGMKRIAGELGVPVQVNHVGSLGSVFFTGEPVRDYASAKTSDTEIFARYHRNMLQRGILLAPSQFEALFISAEHGEEEIRMTLEAFRASLEEIKG